jgi:hypothetical protein
MGRVNKLTEGVFTNIVGNSSQISGYDQFISYGDSLSSSKELNQFTSMYRDVITKMKTEFEKIAQLEKIVMQLRSRDNIDDIKLSVVREYVYARCSFYRDDKSTKDIRVIVEKTEFCGQDVDKLLGNKEFMSRAKDKLTSAMNEEIKYNITNYKKTN